MPKFTKSERLCKRNTIGKLFEEGQSFACYPVRLVWLKTELEDNTEPAQVMVSVSKRYFKNATARNLLKRRMREAWRLNKALFYDILKRQGSTAAFALIMQSRKPESFATIQESIIQLAKKFESKTNASENLSKEEENQ